MLRNFRPIHAVTILATLAVTAIGVSLSFLLWDLHEREFKHAMLETESLTQMMMDQTAQNFDTADLVLQGVQERMLTPFGLSLPVDGPAVRLLLSSRISGLRHLRSLFIVDPQGMVANTSRPEGLARVSVADREYFKVFAEGRQEGLYIDRPVKHRTNGLWTLNLSRALIDAKGRFLGVVVAAFDINQFEQLYSVLKLDFERPVSIYLVDGTLVASVPHREELIGTQVPELLAQTALAPGVNARRHVTENGAIQTLSLGRLQNHPIVVSVINDHSEALGSWRETAVPIAVGAGLVCLFIGLVASLLARELKREESLARALEEANDRHRHTVNSVMDAIIAIDELHNIVLFNPAAERMFSRHANDMLGKPMGLLVPQSLRDTHDAHISRFLLAPVSQGSLQKQLEIRGLRANGEEFPIESTISKTFIGGKVQMTAVLRDITQHRLTEANLREANTQLRDLYSSMQNVREEERTRIARELHDELGQQLTGLKLDMSWLNTRLKEGRPPTADKMDGMRHLLDETIASVRRISSDLRPLILDDLGFGEAVTWQAQEIAKRANLEIHLELHNADLVTDPHVSTSLFRIVQESLTNVLRHSEATRVEIDLSSDDKNLTLSIRDNGKGFRDTGRQSGIGLLNMRERSLSMGGQFQIISAPGDGSTILVTTPLPNPLPQPTHLAAKPGEST